MKAAPDTAGLVPWQHFVIRHGWRAAAHDMAHVLGRDAREILKLRATGACTRLRAAKPFAELFALWHGRAPLDAEWPVPLKLGSRAEYLWQPPEIALLATLVGQVGPEQIAQTLTARLRQITGDAGACRSRFAVLTRMSKIGLTTSDVVGGIATTEAAKETGSLAVVQKAIESGQLRVRRSGRIYVIPHKNWEAWKAQRTFPPEGYVALASLAKRLGISSDSKLPEFANMGYIPTAVRCNPYGRGANTQFGTWYICPKVAERLVADRRAGKPMPWHGKPLMDNLKVTFKLWQQRQHPKCCETCATIWGAAGAPKSFDDYVKRYPELAHGAKRHLTRPWTPGLTLDEVAAHAKRTRAQVRQAIDSGALAFSVIKGRKYVSRTDATRWITRKCPSGESSKSWISLSTACKQYLFTERELRELIAKRKLKTRTGTDGAARGVVYVLRQQCAQLREKIGFSEEAAAARLGVTLPRLRALLEGVDWRGAAGIPLVTVQAARKRLESREGYDINQAAGELGVPVQWVQEQIDAGLVRVSRAKWDRRRRYLTGPMVERLRQALAAPAPSETVPEGSMGLGDAAFEAGVCTTTVMHWAEDGDVKRVASHRGWRYQRASLRARARRYWKDVRFRRATPPAWLASEAAGIHGIDDRNPQPQP